MRPAIHVLMSVLFAASLLMVGMPAYANDETSRSQMVAIAKVSPILECVEKVSDTSYIAHFGYKNPNSFDVDLDIGADNKFTPSPQDRGQPTTFTPGRTPYWPHAAFQVPFDGNNLVWTLNGKTSTASRNSTPCSVHVFVEKQWVDGAGMVMDGPPADLPTDYVIKATSSMGTAVCSYPTGSATLTCTYTNAKPALDNVGLWVPNGQAYTVEEEHLPTGWSVKSGVGTATASVDSAGCGVNGVAKYCTHTIINTSEKDTPPTKPNDVIFDDPDTPLCVHEPTTLSIGGIVSVNTPTGAATLQLAWYIVHPEDLKTETVYDHFPIRDGERFSYEVPWPGIRPDDTIVEVHIGGNLLDEDGNPIMDWGSSLDYYWYPWFCAAGEVTPSDGGVISTSNGDLNMSFVAQSVSESVTVSYARRTTASQSVPTGMHGLRFFTLDAQTADGRAVEAFAQPYNLSLAVTMADLRAERLNPASLAILYRSSGDTEWVRVPMTFDVTQGQASAALTSTGEFVLVAAPSYTIFVPAVAR